MDLLNRLKFFQLPNMGATSESVGPLLNPALNVEPPRKVTGRKHAKLIMVASLYRQRESTVYTWREYDSEELLTLGFDENAGNR